MNIFARPTADGSSTIKQPILRHIRGFFGDGRGGPGRPGGPLVGGGLRDGLRAGVHPTAVLGKDVQLDDGVVIGPYCVLEGRVNIGAGSHVLAHSVVQGSVLIGVNCRLGPHAAIGTDPQHRGYDGGETYLVIEDDVIAREFSSVHRATKPGLENATRVGRGVMLMAGSHVAHDCRVGDDVTLANAVQLGGHVTVGERAFLGGGVLVHQFCRIGRLAIVGGGEVIIKDVLPFGAIRDGGHRAYNAVGCRRVGLEPAVLRGLRSAFHTLHAHRTFPQAARALRDGQWPELSGEVREVIEFIESSKRGVHPSVGRGETTDASE